MRWRSSMSSKRPSRERILRAKSCCGKFRRRKSSVLLLRRLEFLEFCDERAWATLGVFNAAKLFGFLIEDNDAGIFINVEFIEQRIVGALLRFGERLLVGKVDEDQNEISF